MELSQVQRAIGATQTIAGKLGFAANDAVVIHNSDRIAVHLRPCDLLVRIASEVWADDFQFEADVAHALTATNSPVGLLAPGVGPRVYLRDRFAMTFWTYYAPMGEVAPVDYADALVQLHAGLRQIELAAPHITVRLTGWAAEVDDRAQTPDLTAADREFLRATFQRLHYTAGQSPSAEQLLHGEPHPGNLLATSHGPRFIDLQTCQHGPIEYDLAFLPEEAAAHYPGANQPLVHQCRALNWAGFTTMRWRAGDQFPDQAHWRAEGFNLLRAALGRL